MENHDAFLADWLIIDNNTEIEMAKLALQKAASDEVKQFAPQKMIADHQKLNEQLMRFAGNQAPREKKRRAPMVRRTARIESKHRTTPRRAR